MYNYPTIDMAATGNRIRELRREHHMRVDDIVSFMGFESQQAVYKWQRGESLPSVDNLYALSKLFGTTIDDIIVGDYAEGVETPSDCIRQAGIIGQKYSLDTAVFLRKTTDILIVYESDL